MQDEFAGQRLPDLPTAGYSTQRERMTTDAIMMFMRGVERNRPLLLDIVLDGRAKFRRVAGHTWRGLLINTELLDSIYAYFVLQAGPQPEAQREALKSL